jgi:hypothetical protein
VITFFLLLPSPPSSTSKIVYEAFILKSENPNATLIGGNGESVLKNGGGGIYISTKNVFELSQVLSFTSLFA